MRKKRHEQKRENNSIRFGSVLEFMGYVCACVYTWSTQSFFARIALHRVLTSSLRLPWNCRCHIWCNSGRLLYYTLAIWQPHIYLSLTQNPPRNHLDHILFYSIRFSLPFSSIFILWIAPLLFHFFLLCRYSACSGWTRSQSWANFAKLCSK